MTNTLTKQEVINKLTERVESNLKEGGDYGFGKVAAFRKSIELVGQLEHGASREFVSEIVSLVASGKLDDDQIKDILDEEFGTNGVQ
ncbi:hypothetical protein BPS13_0205 [Bacillus phage BPS13]|uniref:Uncharacterized protein n=2 Tax=Wphvirus BPS13 TaxID=1987727 RepID=A0A173GC31_9CAUD|nr:hypothetical protein [Bacillus thuringiensis]YP_006907764.1 hypothetical protein BPS13_0205 [Bacillus phage BPS13]YP_009282096.1 hypothetical protein SALINJAH_142 [Bacillus phage SalinJah]AEZ50384.1 hypothetical protein BPS13_0205 [Bacillus phage BPS13]ANH50609.1 hypothetical protein SALINJAH_142 [Bacillus phage SalinJah]OTZ47818.1 hypothetical protein BK762_19210 [Bacillus thuringiensis serovar toumanoffi]